MMSNMEKQAYIQPRMAMMAFADPLMDTIVESPNEAPVVDDGEELGGNSSSVWDCEWDHPVSQEEE